MHSIDVIILSLASTPELRAVTERCLQSLAMSEATESSVHLNILVIESASIALPYAGTNVKTVFPQAPFGYHAYMNIGIRMTNSSYVCLCNNDLLFHRGWATAFMAAFASDQALMSVSPLCSRHHPQLGIIPNSGMYYGYTVRREISGWCLCFRRSMLDITGPLDETFKFWFADNDYAKTLECHGLRHALVTDSIVDHVESKTLKTHGLVRQRLLTKKAKIDFDKKWNGLCGIRLARKLVQFYLKLTVLAIRERYWS